MLKHAIDTYNVLLNLAETLKLKLTTLIGLLAVLIAGASLLTTQALGSYSASEVDGDTAIAQKTGQTAPSLAEQSKSEDASDKIAGQSSVAAGGGATQGSTESRQANLSENSAKTNFNIKIERNGQVTAGTVIGYNAAKDQRIYYGGDLLVSAATLTISKKDQTVSARSLTVNAPDDAVVGLPIVSKDDAGQRFTVNSDGADVQQPARSFNLTVIPADDLAVGSYQLHLVASRNGQAADSWMYHGFVTVNIID